MNEISPEYTLLFNTITDAIAQLDSLRAALVQAQIRAETLYIGADFQEK